MTLKAYVPLILLTDENAPNALHLSDHMAAVAADWNKRGDVYPYTAPSPTVPPPQPQQPLTVPYPTGKGLFLWQPASVFGGNVGAIVSKLVEMHVEWLAVKINDGANDFNGNLRPLINSLHDANIQAWGWGYYYGGRPGMTPAAEGAKAAARANDLQLNGYIIDAEGEAVAAGPGPAAAYAAALKTNLKSGAIGLCSYRYPSLHADLPWPELLAPCTFHMPQLYWAGTTAATQPGIQLARSVKELQAKKAIPVVPLGVAAPLGSWTPTVDQMVNFAASVRAMGLPGYGYYSMDSAVSHADWLRQITAEPRLPVG